MDAVQVEMNHSLNCLAAKSDLSARRDGMPWQPSDSWRRTKQGPPLEMRGAVCEYRGDMPERSARAAMKGHGGSMDAFVALQANVINMQNAMSVVWATCHGRSEISTNVCKSCHNISSRSP